MNKMILIAMFVLFSVNNSLAADQAIEWANKGLSVVTTDTTPKAIGKLSSGVTLGFNVLASGYALITQHQLGKKAYASAHDSTAIVYKDVEVGATTAAPASADGASISPQAGTGWTVM
jgi:hypothetical protein